MFTKPKYQQVSFPRREQEVIITQHKDINR